MDPFVLEWLHLIARWAHVVVGAAWIGTSFYFNWLNNHVRPVEEGQKALWSVHGGAFYRVTKFTGAPEQLPETLHWFKYEAYATWVSGACLLTFVYWLQADAFMVDPSVAAISGTTAAGIGMGSLVVGWVVYDLLCKSPLAERPGALGGVIATLLVGAAYGLTQVLSARAAYIHTGAMMGTIMAANVFFVIIPGQRDMVDAMLEGREPPLERGRAGSLRSLHNNYFTLPVLFAMVSNHFPSTYGNAMNWALLAGIAAVGVAVRHWFNLRGQGHVNTWLLPAAAVGIVSLAFVAKPPVFDASAHVGGDVPSFAEVQGVVQRRCVACHAAEPTQPGFTAPPKNLVLTDPQAIVVNKDAIHAQAVASKIMPLGNLTGMTDEERGILARWYAAGAPQ
jgi:uncharacterized membrane protein